MLEGKWGQASLAPSLGKASLGGPKEKKAQALQRFGASRCEPSEVGGGLERSESRKKAVG